MSKIVLRWYQVQAIEKLRESVASGHKRIVLQLATGAGKTAVAAEIVRMARAKGTRVMFLAPRRELVYQAATAFRRVGLVPGLIMAGEQMMRHMADVHVASFDTLHARCIRRKVMPLPAADMLIVDECHITGAARERILDAYPDAVIIGLTATPCRADGRGLGEIYSDMVLGVDIGTLTEEGYLVPARYYSPSEPDLRDIKLDKHGDYQAKQLGGRVNTPELIGDVVTHWQRLAAGKTTVVFAVDRAHARALHGAFESQGVASVYVDGETPAEERADALAAIQAGRALVLVNVFVATYGLDLPRLEVCVLARPTRSLSLYLQMIGRCLRPFPGKEECLVIDHSGAVRRLGFAADDHPWSLDGKETISERVQKQKEEKKEPKEIVCGTCFHVFSGRRDCPKCGAVLIGRSEPIPVHEAELVEVKKKAEPTMQEKGEWYAGLAMHALGKGFKPGWAANQYREKFGVWPNHPTIRNWRIREVPKEVRSWIVSQQIRYARRKAK